MVALIAYANITQAQEISSTDAEKEKLIFSNEPLLKITEALAIAQEYIKKNKIDISKHYLDNIRLLQHSTWMEGKHWVITWKLKIRAEGGQIFIIVGMDKKTKIVKGL